MNFMATDNRDSLNNDSPRIVAIGGGDTRPFYAVERGGERACAPTGLMAGLTRQMVNVYNGHVRETPRDRGVVAHAAMARGDEGVGVSSRRAGGRPSKRTLALWRVVQIVMGYAANELPEGIGGVVCERSAMRFISGREPGAADCGKIAAELVKYFGRLPGDVTDYETQIAAVRFGANVRWLVNRHLKGHKSEMAHEASDARERCEHAVRSAVHGLIGDRDLAAA